VGTHWPVPQQTRLFVAFFDDDPPTQQRRSNGPPTPPRPPRTPRGAQDPQQILARRAVAIGVIVLVLLVFALLMKGCVESSKKNALQDYGQSVADIGTESTSNVSQGLQLLAQPNERDALAQRNSLDKLATDSRTLEDKARELSTPGGLEGASQNLVVALSLRADALSRIADRISTARGTSKAQAEEATQQIAGQMQSLLASDVLWQLRVTPYIRDRAKELDARDDGVENSVVLTDISWLNAATVANRIDGQSETPDTTAATCTDGSKHGHELTSLAANGKALTEGASAVTNVSNSAGLSFVATITNQGDSDESNVSVTVTGTSKATGKQVFSETKRQANSTKGESTQFQIPVTKAVTSAVTITAEVKGVPCEVNKDNNKKSFQVIFN
jgi:hypothetical protein